MLMPRWRIVGTRLREEAERGAGHVAMATPTVRIQHLPDWSASVLVSAVT